MTIYTVQEGCCAIAEAVVEKRTKARGPGCPCTMTKLTKTPITAYDIQDWMQGVEEDASKKGARKVDAFNCRPEQINAHSRCTG